MRKSVHTITKSVAFVNCKVRVVVSRNVDSHADAFAHLIAYLRGQAITTGMAMQELAAAAGSRLQLPGLGLTACPAMCPAWRPTPRATRTRIG